MWILYKIGRWKKVGQSHWPLLIVVTATNEEGSVETARGRSVGRGIVVLLAPFTHLWIWHPLLLFLFLVLHLPPTPTILSSSALTHFTRLSIKSVYIPQILKNLLDKLYVLSLETTLIIHNMNEIKIVINK